MALPDERRWCHLHGTEIPGPGYACVDCVANRPPRISLSVLQDVNAQRAVRWHHGTLTGWSPLEWAGAMCGEAGEAANVAKKLKRVENELQHVDMRDRTWAVSEKMADEYRRMLARECADTILYAILTITRVGHDAEDIVREVFNEKSVEYGFPERI